MQESEDCFVLKPKQSAFIGTPLELLLHHLGVQQRVLIGVASGQCVLVTVSEAVMRDLEAVVPKDCVAPQTTQPNDLVLKQLENFHKVPTSGLTTLRFR